MRYNVKIPSFKQNYASLVEEWNYKLESQPTPKETQPPTPDPKNIKREMLVYQIIVLVLIAIVLYILSKFFGVA